MTIKVVIKGINKDGVCPIVVRVRSGESSREFPVGFKVKPAQFENGTVKNHHDKALINAKIAEKIAMITRYQTDCITSNTPVNLKDIGDKRSGSFISYLKGRLKNYKDNDQPSAARRLDYIIKELQGLFGDLSFKGITGEVLRKYQVYLSSKHQNTIHKRFTTLKQLFANAVNEGVYIGANPFVLLKISKQPVKKEKLTAEEIASIEKVKLRGHVALARDVFLFSYYCKGIRFENCAFLHWNDIIGDRIYIKTNKGKKHISVQIHRKLKKILDRYKGNGFVFNLVDRLPVSQAEKEKLIHSKNSLINKDLKVVAAAAGIDKTVSMHIARHSIAFHLKKQGVNVGAIKDILGHSQTQTTEIYLKSLDDESLDDAMSKVYG